MFKILKDFGCAILLLLTSCASTGGAPSVASFMNPYGEISAGAFKHRKGELKNSENYEVFVFDYNFIDAYTPRLKYFSFGAEMGVSGEKIIGGISTDHWGLMLWMGFPFDSYADDFYGIALPLQSTFDAETALKIPQALLRLGVFPYFHKKNLNNYDNFITPSTRGATSVYEAGGGLYISIHKNQILSWGFTLEYLLGRQIPAHNLVHSFGMRVYYQFDIASTSNKEADL